MQEAAHIRKWAADYKPPRAQKIRTFGLGERLGERLAFLSECRPEQPVLLASEDDLRDRPQLHI